MAKAKVLSPALILLALAGIALFGCSEIDSSGPGPEEQIQETDVPGPDPDPENQAQNNIENNAGVNILTSIFPSPKEQNPYSVENMNKLMKEYPNGTPNGKGGKVAYFKADMDALFKYWETGDGAPCPEPIADDRDGKAYRTAIIGSQTWMAENLSYEASGSSCYSNSAAYCDKYGRLYDWAAALEACPEGWRLPSVEDWNVLMRYVDGDSSAYSPYDSPTASIHLKAQSGWNSDGNGKDTYGFSALPGGYGGSDGFRNLGYNGDWWSATEYDGSAAYRFDLYYGDKAGWSDVGGTNRRFDKSNLYSIRCLKD